MPYTDLVKRKEYHRNYMRVHKQILTPEQKAQRKEYMKKYSLEKSDKLSAYQHERWLRDKAEISERKRLYDKAHPEIRKQQSKVYYQNNKEKIANYKKEYTMKNVSAIKEKKRLWRKTPQGRLVVYRSSAKVRGLDFSLPTDEFNALLVQDCHYCGKPKANGVDRRDSNVGYFSYNVVPCCSKCNYMKGTHNYQEFINHIMLIVKHLT